MRRLTMAVAIIWDAIVGISSHAKYARAFCQGKIYTVVHMFSFCANRRVRTERELMVMYSPQEIANFFLDKSEEAGLPMTAMKLQKLVYIAYGWFLALTNEKLFNENIEAWQHGPVIPSLYHEFKRFRGNPIEARASTYDYDSNDLNIPSIDEGDDETLAILSRVWDIYHPFSGWVLRQKTHQDGTPWKQVYDPACLSRPIPDNLIADHFRDRIKAYLDAASA